MKNAIMMYLLHVFGYIQNVQQLQSQEEIPSFSFIMYMRCCDLRKWGCLSILSGRESGVAITSTYFNASSQKIYHESNKTCLFHSLDPPFHP